MLLRTTVSMTGCADYASPPFLEILLNLLMPVISGIPQNTNTPECSETTGLSKGTKIQLNFRFF
jgi:hypothetical protein